MDDFKQRLGQDNDLQSAWAKQSAPRSLARVMDIMDNLDSAFDREKFIAILQVETNNRAIDPNNQRFNEHLLPKS